MVLGNVRLVLPDKMLLTQESESNLGGLDVIMTEMSFKSFIDLYNKDYPLRHCLIALQECIWYQTLVKKNNTKLCQPIAIKWAHDGVTECYNFMSHQTPP